jgi:hypothetical protein
MARAVESGIQRKAFLDRTEEAFLDRTEADRATIAQLTDRHLAQPTTGKRAAQRGEQQPRAVKQPFEK